MYSGRPTVVYHQLGQAFNIHTDASDYMVAGILSQTGEDGNEYPTAFYSK